MNYILSTIVITERDFLNGITYDAAGNIYVSDNNRIYKVDPVAGTYTTILETTSANGLLFDDANNRLLIPKRLLSEIGADKELVLAGQFGKIEIWPKDVYQKIESGSPDFAALAEKIMGNINNESDE